MQGYPPPSPLPSALCHYAKPFLFLLAQEIRFYGCNFNNYSNNSLLFSFLQGRPEKTVSLWVALARTNEMAMPKKVTFKTLEIMFSWLMFSKIAFCTQRVLKF